MWEQSLLAMQTPRFHREPHRLHRGQALLPQAKLPSPPIVLKMGTTQSIAPAPYSPPGNLPRWPSTLSSSREPSMSQPTRGGINELFSLLKPFRLIVVGSILLGMLGGLSITALLATINDALNAATAPT